MSLRRRHQQSGSTILRWDQQVEPYDGALRDLYAAGRNLLTEAFDAYTVRLTESRRLGRRARRLSLTTTVLAATASVTVLPDEAGRWIGAAIAFAAAVVSGYIGQSNPSAAAARAERQAAELSELKQDLNRYLRTVRRLPDTEEARSQLEDELTRLHARRNSALARINAPVPAAGP